MAAVFNLEITSAGGSFSYDPLTWGTQDAIISVTTSAPITLVANVDISFANPIAEGGTVRIIFAGGVGTIDLDGNSFSIDGANNFPQWLLNTPWMYTNTTLNGGQVVQVYTDIFYCNGLSGTVSLLDGTVALTKLANLTSANLIVGNGSNIPTAVAMSGDITMTNAGVTAIGAGVIVNADVNASAAIARTKLASGTASYIVANDGSGVMTDQQYVTKAQGGFGQNVAAATGFTTFSSGTLSIAAIAEVVTLQVSFETGFVGDFKVKMPFAGTVTEIYAFLDKAIGAVDATITPKNNSGTTMSSGVLTFTASDPKGTAQTSSPSANNTFVDTDTLTFTTAGGSAAGVATLSIKVTRTS